MKKNFFISFHKKLAQKYSLPDIAILAIRANAIPKKHNKNSFLRELQEDILQKEKLLREVSEQGRVENKTPHRNREKFYSNYAKGLLRKINFNKSLIAFLLTASDAMWADITQKTRMDK